MRFNKIILSLCLSVSFSLIAFSSFSIRKYDKSTNGVYYRLKVYHYKTRQQEERLDNYFKNAYVPALHQMGIKTVGVFKTLETDTIAKCFYILEPYKSLEEIDKVAEKILSSKEYHEAAKDYFNALYNDPPYTRVEAILLGSFPKAPVPAVPQLTAEKTQRVYELRSYESATEKLNINKVQMFNAGDEVGLFKRLGFNAVFYAEVLYGSHQPNLMYMTTFNSKEDRDKHWDTFNNDAYWKTLVAKKEYQNNVSHADIIFLHPTAYSDF